MSFWFRNIELEYDYDMLVKWWEDWGQTAPAKSMLTRYGLLVGKEKKYICSAFLYFTDSEMVFISWFLSNKAINKQERSDALDFLLEKLEEKIKVFNKTCAYAMLDKNCSLGKKLVNSGFAKHAMNEYIKII